MATKIERYKICFLIYIEIFIIGGSFGISSLQLSSTIEVANVSSLVGSFQVCTCVHLSFMVLSICASSLILH